MRLLAVPLALLALPPFHSAVRPLPAGVQSELRSSAVWRPVCPVTLSQLRLLSVTYVGFDGRAHPGSLVVNERATGPLAQVFRRLYELRFPIRHLRVRDAYGPPGSQPRDNDISGSFDCRQAIASPCSGAKATGTGSWSMHAYGLAVDLNPVENPYVGCGRTRHRSSSPYLDRSRLRRGMVTPAVVAAFGAVGWGWGGSWAGSTKDYMHFSASGH
jgi:D-alanyl-D-alanine carboxypeptidase